MAPCQCAENHSAKSVSSVSNSTHFTVVWDHMHCTMGKCVHISVLVLSANDIMITFQHNWLTLILVWICLPYTTNCALAGTSNLSLGLQNHFHAPFYTVRLLRILTVAHNTCPRPHAIHNWMLRHFVSSWICTVEFECRASCHLNRESSLQPVH